MTITDFLMARIAEDEVTARAASHQKVAGPFHGDWTPNSVALTAGGILDHADRTHIACWDPRRVLAECEAKRRIVELHEGTHECVGAGPGGWLGVGDEDSPCPTLRALTLPYADHPDYDAEWATT